MEPYSCYSSSSSSSPMHFSQYPHNEKTPKVSHSFHSSLHSVRKPQIKPWKKPIAPLPPTPPRVFRVDPIHFRDLVQKLTGAPDQSFSQSQQRLQRLAPPPLDLEKQKPTLFDSEFSTVTTPLQLLPSPVKTSYNRLYQELMSDTPSDLKPSRQVSESLMASSSLDFNLLSPSTHVWSSFPLLSPGTLSSLEQSTVL